MNRFSAIWNPRVIAVALLSAVLLPVVSGCAGYRLGSMLPEDIESIYIPTIRNATNEPLVEIETTQALLRELQTDGSLKIASENLADAVLDIQINQFRLIPLVFSREDRSRPAEYTVQLTAAFRLVRASDGAVVASNPRVSGDFFVPFVSDLTSAKRRVLPDVARDLAHKIVELIVESWADSGAPPSLVREWTGGV